MTSSKRKGAAEQQPSATVYNTCSIEGLPIYVEDGIIDLEILDPPFGIKGDRVSYRISGGELKDFIVPGYQEVAAEKYASFAHDFMRAAYNALRKGGTACVFTSGRNLHHIRNAADRIGFRYDTKVVWVYSGMYCTNRFIESHYDILIFTKPPLKERTFNTCCRFKSPKVSSHDRDNVWLDIPRKRKQKGEMRNMNRLQENLVGKLIDYCSNPGDTVLDMFGGEFTVGHAALKKGRNYIAFEINKHAVDEFAENLPTDDLTIYQ